MFCNVPNLKDIQFAGRFVSDNRELAIPALGASATESRACSLDPIPSLVQNWLRAIFPAVTIWQVLWDMIKYIRAHFMSG